MILCVCVCERCICGRSRVYFPAGVEPKTFTMLGDLLTTSISEGLSVDSGYIFLENTR